MSDIILEKFSSATSLTHSGADVSTSSGLTLISEIFENSRAKSNDSGPPVTNTAFPSLGITKEAKSKNGQNPVKYLTAPDSHSLL